MHLLFFGGATCVLAILISWLIADYLVSRGEDKMKKTLEKLVLDIEKKVAAGAENLAVEGKKAVVSEMDQRIDELTKMVSMYTEILNLMSLKEAFEQKKEIKSS